MPSNQPALWGSGDAYERYMGRWSRKVAPLFTDWLGAGEGLTWMDVGCGTGVLTSTILDRCDPAAVVGIDSAPAMIETVRQRCTDPRASFAEGSAQHLPAEGGMFDVAVSGLVLNFVADKARKLSEMKRVCRPGGTVGLYVWDYAGHMQIMRTFFDAARALDGSAAAFDDGVKAPECRPGPLAGLFEDAGLAAVEVTALDITAAFDDFDDYWKPFLGGTGSAPKYCASLDEVARMRLREAVRRLIRTGPDGEILLAARAWGVKGRVP